MRKELQRYFPIWEQLSETEKEALACRARLQRYAKGRCVHNGHDACIGLILVRKGQLRTYMLSADGREVTLFRIGEGEVCILSASCIFEAITFDVCIDAETDAEVIQIDSPFYQEMSEKNIYMKCFAYEIATKRFSDVMWAMEQILFMSMDKRLGTFLWEEIGRTGNPLRLTHDQIARYMGSAREVVSRMLKYFEQEGIVSLGRGQVQIIDEKKLRKIIE